MKPIFFIKAVCIIVFIVIITSCQKDDWVDVEINTSGCTTGQSLGFANEAEGTIHGTDLQDQYYIETNDVLESASENQVLWPCNVSFTESQEGQKIIFSGEIFGWPDIGNDSIAVDYFGIPIKISNAKFLKK